MIDFSRNHYALFGLPERFRFEADALDRAYRALQTEVHPDRHVAGDDAQQRLALQADVRAEAAAIERRLAQLLDGDGAWAAARMPVRELRFLTKLQADIGAMAAVLEE